MRTVTATAPCRVDLAGGTLDLWPLSQLVDEAVTVNAAIDVMTGCTLRVGGAGWTLRSRDSGETVTLSLLPRRPENEVPRGVSLAAVVAAHFELPPCSLETWSQAGRGSGLGGSSALVISLVAASAACIGRELSLREMVDIGCNLETRILGLPAGSQDHWAAARGGVTILGFGAEGVTALSGPPGSAEVCEALVVADTAVEHHSGMNNWAVYKAYLERDPVTRAALDEVAAAARAMRDALALEDVTRALPAARLALGAEWDARRRLAPEVSSPEVERVIDAARSVGGAGKVCGAGGGGCVACLPGDGGRDELVRAVAATGARILSARPRPEGVRWEVAEGP